MREKYNLVGHHKDDKKPIVIATFPSKEEALAAAEEATERDPDNNWKFYAEPVRTEVSNYG